MSKAVVIAFEGTLSDPSDRAHLDWDEYYALLGNDKPVEAMISLANVLGEQYDIVVFTTTPEKYRQELTHWLLDNEVNCDKLLMKPNNEFKNEIEVKTALLDGVDVFVIFDDKEATVLSLRDLGYTVMEV